ncbi:MAG: hypothetical protein MMC23_007061 [Stictis urceolatum]|nr:hypothetical protein [Stictis urceolata]
MVDVLKTVGGWALVMVAGLCYWVYIQRPQRSKQAPRRGPTQHAKLEQVKQAQRQRGPFKKEKNGTLDKEAGDAATTDPLTDSGRELLKDRKKGKQKGPKEATSFTFESAPAIARTSPSEDADNRAFAAQLARTQQGTTLKTAEKNTRKVKTNKQGKANKVAGELASATESSTPASTNGGDADDDMSPRMSPEVAATVPRSDPSGVADMIEPAAPGPSTLRITALKEPVRQQKPKVAKQEAEVESKKQRQRRKKNELRKAEAAETEKERKAALERQLKTARTAEGTAKSHISKVTAPPQNNAWTSSNGPKPEEPATQAVLLDTYEPPAATEKAESTGEVETAANGNHGPNGANVPNGAGVSASNENEWEGWETLSREAKQSSDEGWQDATSKKSKKKNKKPTEGASATAESV